MSSSPMLSRPTVGRSMPSTAVTSALPMTANWTSCSGVQLTLAPRSSAVVTPLRVGSCDAIAGRSMPGSVFSTKRAIAISAPVLPADTHACACPSRTRLIATRIDESFFLRNASAGGSSIATTSAAAWTVIRSRAGERARASACVRGSGSPTRMARAAGVSSRNASVAGTVTEGPWSPPIASTATVTVMGSRCHGKCGPSRGGWTRLGGSAPVRRTRRREFTRLTANPETAQARPAAGRSTRVAMTHLRSVRARHRANARDARRSARLTTVDA